MKTTNEQKNQGIIKAENGGMLYSFLVVCALAVTVFASVIISLIAGGDELVLNSDAVNIINYLLSPIAIALAIGILGYKEKKSPLKCLGSIKFESKPLIATLLIAFGMIFGLSELNVYFVSMLEGFGFSVGTPTLPSKTVINVIFTIIVVCVIPPIVEEIAFRGIILKSLEKTGEVFAVIASGLLFALFHMSPAQTIYQFVVGVIFALLTIKGKNIAYAVIVHAINNLYIVINYYFIGFVPTGALKIVLTVIALIALFIGLFILIYKSQKLEEGKDKKKERTGFILGAILGAVATITVWIMGLI